MNSQSKYRYIRNGDRGASNPIGRRAGRSGGNSPEHPRYEWAERQIVDPLHDRIVSHPQCAVYEAEGLRQTQNGDRYQSTGSNSSGCERHRAPFSPHQEITDEQQGIGSQQRGGCDQQACRAVALAFHRAHSGCHESKDYQLRLAPVEIQAHRRRHQNETRQQPGGAPREAASTGEQKVHCDCQRRKVDCDPDPERDARAQASERFEAK